MQRGGSSRHHGGQVVLDRVSVSVTAGGGWGGRAERDRQVHVAAGARRPGRSPTPGRSSGRRPTVTVACCRRSRTRAAGEPSALPRPPDRRGRCRGGLGPRTAALADAPDGIEQYAVGARALPRGRGRRLRGPGVDAEGAAVGLGVERLAVELGGCRVGERHGARWPRSCCRASTCSCSTSRRTTSTSPGSTGWRGSDSTLPVAWWSCPTTGRSSIGRSLGCSSSGGAAHTRFEYTGGWWAYVEARGTCRAAEEDHAKSTGRAQAPP